MRSSAFANTKVDITDNLSLQELRVRVAGGRLQLPGFSTRTSPQLLALLAVVTAITLCTGVLLTKTAKIPLPGILGSESEGVSRSLIAPHSSRARHLERLEQEQMREMATNVHFLSGLISSTNSRVAAEAKELAYLIASESKAANIDPVLVTAVVKSESAFRTAAKSPVGALGLMQIMPSTGQFVAKMYGLPWSGKSRLVSDPRYNLRIGIAYLQYLLDKYDGDSVKALWAYNWGPANVYRLSVGEARLPNVTKRYASTILSDHGRWRELFAKKQSEYRFLNVSYLGSRAQSL